MSIEYKDYQIVKHEKFTTVLIKSKGTGKVPKELQGAFVSPKSAMQHIDTFYAKKHAGAKKPKTKKVTEDAKTEVATGSK